MLCWTPEHPLCDFRKLLAVSQRDSLQGETALTDIATRIELRTYSSLSGQYPSLLASKLWSFCPRTPVASTRASVSFTAYQPQLLSEGHSTLPVPFPAGLNRRAGLSQPRSLRLMAPSPRYSSGYQQANCQHPLPGATTAAQLNSQPPQCSHCPVLRAKRSPGLVCVRFHRVRFGP